MEINEDRLWQEMGRVQQEKLAQAEQDRAQLSPEAARPMVDSLQPSSFRTNIDLYEDDEFDFSKEYCGFCADLGYIESEGITAEIFGEKVFVEFKSQRGCIHCLKGRNELRQFHERYGCDCEFGWRKSYQTEKTPGGRMVEVTVVENCLKCIPGRTQNEYLEARIFKHKQDRLNKLMANSGLSEEIAGKSFDNFEAAHLSGATGAKEQVMTAAKEGRSIILMGNPGRGKTHLAAAYLNYWMQERGKAGVFVSLVDLMSALRRTIRATEGPDWDTLLDRYVQADLLVLDDLGQEKATEKVSEVVFHLLNSRINQRKPTVITTNYDLKSLSTIAGYPPSICSRLAGFERVTWDSGDYRLRGKAS
jgi:DNA replication protein DnaC